MPDSRHHQAKTMPKLLLVIANHGFANEKYLPRVIAAYRDMPVECEIVVLSDVPKDLGPDITVAVGAPERNPRSLPFAHRPIFKANIDRFDYFDYSEDDTLLTRNNFGAFVDSLSYLHDDEIAGFLRSETAPSGELSFPDCHGHYRWLPGSVRLRNGELWAKYSDEHAACFIATQQQVRRAFESGGFPLAPRTGRYNLACSASTDIYALCGLEKLICIDRLDDFTVQHLSDKYVGMFGMPAEEMGWQLDALRRIHRGELSDRELFNPETRLPRAVGSKSFHLRAEPVLEQLIGDKAKRVLIWGAGNGLFEASIRQLGHDVTVVPFNAVFGVCCANRGLKVVSEGELSASSDARFDCVVSVDCLHLCDDPQAVLSMLRRYLAPGGKLVARIPNLHKPRTLQHRISAWRRGGRWNRGEIGAHVLTRRKLAELAHKSGFAQSDVEAVVPKEWRKADRRSFGLLQFRLASSLYLNCEQ